MVCGVQDVEIENPENPTSNEDRCIVVTSENNASNSWDSQFWIIPKDGFNAGQEFEILMSVKADYEAYSFEPQVHNNPEDYVGSLPGNLSVHFTTEWSDVSLLGKFDSDGKSVAFNLSDDTRANKYYFDNISFKIDGVETIINGDCQTDENTSFLKKDGGSRASFVNFIQKSSIMPAKPREEQEKTPGTTIFTNNYTTWTSYNYYNKDDYIRPLLSSEDGLVCQPQYNEDGSRMWYQFFAADGIPTEKGKKYSIIVEIRGDEAGSFNANMGWDWNEDPVSTTVEYSTEWETREFFFNGPIGGSTRSNVIFQPGECPYTIYIRNLRVIYQGE